MARRAALTGVLGDTPADVMVLFEVELVDVGWATWLEQTRPIRKRWRAT